MASSPTTAAAAADAAHGEQDIQQLQQQQQHSFAVRAVAAEAASAAGKLFDGSLKEKLGQMLLLLQDDDPPLQPHQQHQQQKQQRRERWRQHQEHHQEQRHRSRRHAGTGPKNFRAAREEEPYTRAATTSSSNSSSSSSSEGEDRSQCSKCRKLQQRLRLERLRRRAEDGEAKQLIARVAAQVTRLSRDAREAAAAAAAAAATAAHHRLEQHSQEQRELLQEERRRSKTLEEELGALRAQLDMQQQQQQQQQQQRQMHEEGESRPEQLQPQLNLLQQQLSSMMQQLLGQADPKMQLLLLRLERLGLRLQQLQQRQERRQQHLVLQQHRLLLQQQGELQQQPSATFLFPPMSGQPQPQQQQQQLLPWHDDPFNRATDTDNSSKRNFAWRAGEWPPHGGIPSPSLSSSLMHHQEQQEQQEQQRQQPEQQGRPVSGPSDGRLIVVPQQRLSHARADACACLGGPLIFRPASSPSCGHNGILTPAAAFARAAAAAEGVLIHPFSNEPHRLCNCSCSLTMMGGGPSLQQGQRVFRQRSSLLSNASVGRRALEAPCRPVTAVAAVSQRAAVAAKAAADLAEITRTASHASSCLQQRPSSTVPGGRLLDSLHAAANIPSEGPASAPEDVQVGARQGEAHFAAGNGSPVTLLGAEQPVGAAHAVSVKIMSPTESVQQQQEEASASVPASADRGHPLPQHAHLRAVPSADTSVTRQRVGADGNSSSSSNSSPALHLVTPCSSPFNSSSSQLRHHPPLHAWQAPHTRQHQQQPLLPKTYFSAAEMQDWQRDARQAEEHAMSKGRDATSAGNLEGQLASETFGEENVISNNASVLTDETTQQMQSLNLQQQLTQSCSGSVSSVDFQQLAALQVPLRQLLNDQQQLLETLDADYSQASFVAPTGDNGRAMVAEREDDSGPPFNADAHVQSTGRWHHREVEVKLSLPMSFLKLNDANEGVRAQRLPSSSTSKGGG
ncbi:hypothetical protein Emag_004552 [Eimeria magna]